MKTNRLKNIASFAFAWLLLAAFASAAYGQETVPKANDEITFTSAETLFDQCEAHARVMKAVEAKTKLDDYGKSDFIKDGLKGKSCIEYISGVADTLALFRSWVKLPKPICLGKTFDAEKTAGQYLEWYQFQAEDMKMSDIHRATALAHMLAQIYPCEEEQ